MNEVVLPARRGGRTLFVSSLADISKEGARAISEVGGTTKHLLFLEGLPVEAIAPRLTQLNIRDPRRLHVVAESDLQSIANTVHRLLSGLAGTNKPQAVVDAWVESGQLVLLSPAFERLEVPSEKLTKLVGDQIEAFVIDEDGRFLHWPDADVHLGWAQLQQLVDPASAVATQKKTQAFNQRYGAAIRAFREEHGLKQSQVAGLTERHLRRIEHGDQAVSKAALESLARAHAMTIEDYLKALAARAG